MQNAAIDRKPQSPPLVKHLAIDNLRTVEENESPGQPAMRSASHYEILWLQSGCGTLFVNLQQHALDSDHIYFISPGQLRTITISEETAGYCISVSADFFDATDNQLSFVCMLQQYRGLGDAMVIPIDGSIRVEMEEIIAKMNREITNAHPLQLEMLQALFRTFLLYLSKGHGAARDIEPRSNDTRIVKMFMQLVSHHFIQKKMVADYADELCVTRSYLNKVVKKVSGFTASQIIQQCVIQEAKKQAIRSGSSMKQIAYSLGFEDSAHFSKFFKTNCGINFTNYKKEIVNFQ